MLAVLPLFGAACAAQGGTPDLWPLAQKNAALLRMSTLFCADQVIRYLSDESGIERSIAWCKAHGITHVYLESHRSGVVPARDVLARARDRFRSAGFIVSGCVTTTDFGKRGTGWTLISCYTSQETRRELRGMFEYAASLFDEVMIDDFLFTDCTCPECTAARGAQSWPDFRREQMLDVSKRYVLEPARKVNPRVKVIIKYPCWHEEYQERGYDVAGETALYDKMWVGTETRGGTSDRNWPAEPQYRAYWLQRWLGGIGGPKCGGGWYDWIGTTPPFYLEQARQTVLGGAREAMLFNFGALYDDALGKQDAEALRTEIPLHFRLAELIHGKPPRGVLGWKPTNSPAGPDRNLEALLGMCGFPVTAAHRFDASAPAFVFGHQATHDAGWRRALGQALRSGRPVLVSQDVVSSAGDVMAGLKDAATVLPAPGDANHWRGLEDLPGLDALRDRAMKGIGSFHSPAGVALYLFGDDVAVIESFRDTAAECTLALDGWKGFETAVVMPAGAASASSGASAQVTLRPRSLIALRRTR